MYSPCAQLHYDIRDELENGSVTMSLFDKESANRILTIGGIMARRISALMHCCENPSFRMRFNCYNAVRQVLGDQGDFMCEPSMEEQGEKMYVQEGLTRFGSPMIFQIVAQDPEAFGDTNLKVAHTGLVLGTEPRLGPVVLDKNHLRAFSFRPWSAVEDQYFQKHEGSLQAKYVTCFPAADLAPRPPDMECMLMTALRSRGLRQS